MGVFRVSKNHHKSGKCHELPRKSIHFLTLLRGWRGRGRREGGDREGEREREAGREGGARAKLGNQLVYNNIIYILLFLVSPLFTATTVLRNLYY